MVLFPLLSRAGVNWILVTKLTTWRSGNSAGDEKETTNILDEFRARHRCNFQQVGSREREATHILSFSPLDKISALRSVRHKVYMSSLVYR